MAALRLRDPRNAAGDMYVDTTCIDCDLCRQIAPAVFSRAGDQSVVHHQPETEAEWLEASKALVTCPTASIGTVGRHPMREAAAAYPERIEDGVHFCGFAAASSYGASSYLITRPDGNVLVDSPRFAGPLVRRIAAAGGIRWIFLTHRDDIADHERWARRFGAERILHTADMDRETAGVERPLHGDAPIRLAPDLLAIPTPGHTRGHTVLLYADRFLFSGDHLWWSDAKRGLWASRNVCWYSWTAQRESLRRLLDHPFEWVLPGHGRRYHAPAETTRVQLEALLGKLTA